MKTTINLIIASLFILFSFGCQKPMNCAHCIAYKNANVLTLKDDKILANHTVLISGDSIIAVLASDEFEGDFILSDSAIVDVQGAYIMPALQEMHAHFEPLNTNHKHYKAYERVPKTKYLQLLKICKEKNIKLASHIPYEFCKDQDLDNLLDSELQCFEHLINFGAFVTSDSIKKVSAPDNTKYYGYDVIANLDSLKVVDLVKKVKTKNIWMCPTSVLWTNPGDTTAINVLVKQKEFIRLDQGLRNWWLSTKGDYARSQSAGVLNDILLKELARQNVKILAGTDFPNPFLIPGYSLHQEIANIARVGYGNLEALKSATVYPAQYWNEKRQTGHLEKGTKANFIILDKNPLQNIENTLSIQQTVFNGQLYHKDKLLTR